MKFHYAVKASYIAISCAILSVTTPVSADDNPFGFNKADSILSDKVFYQIGGGAGYMAPPSRGNIPAAEFGIGWRANLTCGNFDIKTSIKNQLNGLTEGFKELYSNVIESATGAVASLPAMIIQRANPQLYDILTNGLYQGKIDFNNLKTSCEDMSKKLADVTLNGRWSQSADMESYKDITSTEPDATKAKKKFESQQGREGKEWVGGQKRGGEGQESIKIVEDVAKAGYNIQNKRNVLESGRVSKSNCSGLLCQTWDNPKEMTDWLTHVIGEKQLTTCNTNCGTPSSSSAGVGLSPEIEQENIKTVTLLQKALNMRTPSVDILAELSSSTVPVTRGLIESLRDDPDAQVLGQRLASEIAVAKTMEKMLLARRAVLTGMREPNVANNKDAQDELEKVLTLIDREIEQIRMEIDLQKSLTGNSAVAILQNKELREYHAGAANVARDNVDKRISDLANGLNDTSAETMNADDITIPHNNITLQLPQVSNSFSYTGTGGTSGTGSGQKGNAAYSSIPAINGTAFEQATGLLKKFEGFRHDAYWDVNANRAGYGSDTITKADGTVVKVTPGMRVSREDAERDLARRTQEFANRVKRDVSPETWDKLTPKAQAVLTSYAYNYGSLAKTKSVIAAAQESARSGNMTTLANAIRDRQGDNGGVNARRRNQEADYILGK